MRAAQLSYKSVANKVDFWAHKTLEAALLKKDVLLEVQTYVLLDMCNSEAQITIPFEEIIEKKSLENFISLSPLLCVEFLLLMKKYKPELYTSEVENLVCHYESILEVIKKESPENFDVFVLLHKISSLKNEFSNHKEITIEIKVFEDDFLLKSKSAIDKKLNEILIATNFGKYSFNLTAKVMESIETIMLDAAKKYDLILVAKAFKVLMYANAENSYVMKYIYDFLLKNQSIEGYIGHYDVEISKTNSHDKALSQQLQITKEILFVISLYIRNYTLVAC